MENFTYKGISGSKYVSGEIEAINLDEASHKLKQQKIIITNITKLIKKELLKKKKRKKVLDQVFLKKRFHLKIL